MHPEKGKDGTLVATVRIIEEIERWRQGNDIHTRHYVPLRDALQGCVISVPTVHGPQDIKLPQKAKESLLKLDGKGALGIA